MQKPKLSFWQIWNMSFGFLGIQFGFALQNANVSRIFQSLGAEVDDIPILWVAAPATGLIVQPIIGYLSDRTWSPKWGRRRPFFLIGAILSSIALVVMPNSPTWMIAAGMLWILDASINISMEPFRAFVGDNLPDEQRTSGFAMQSFFIGLGAVVASALPWMMTNWMGISNEPAPGEQIPANVYWSFYIGAVVFIVAVLWTVFKSFEYSPEELEKFEHEEVKEFRPEISEEEAAKMQRRKMMTGTGLFIVGSILTTWLMKSDLPKDLYIFSIGIALAGIIALISGFIQSSSKISNAFTTIVNDFQLMPKTMKQLASVQFFSWFALFAMWIYTTSAVTSHIYGTTDTASKVYNDAADNVGWWFGVYNGVAALAAFLIPIMARRTSRKFTHMLCLTLGGIGLISIYFIEDPVWINLSMVGVGFAWSSILSIPYAILSGSLPSDKMGYYMGVFNFFIVIPQLVAAALLGSMIGYFFNKESIFALIIGGISMILAGVLTLRVQDSKLSAN